MTNTLFPDAVITGELLEHLRLPGLDRYELVEGRIEVLTPTNLYHAEATVRIAALLLNRMPGWHILGGDPGVYVHRQPDTVRGPDVIAISDERFQQRDRGRAFLTVMPELIVEITSPSNEDEDIKRKVAEYVRAGAIVWVVNLDTRRVTVTDQAGSTDCMEGDHLRLPNGDRIAVAHIYD